MLIISSLLIAACASSSDDNDEPDATATPESVQPTSTPDNAEPNPDETEESDDQAEEEAEETPAGRRGLTPYAVTLSGESGEQTGQIGPHFWTDDEAMLAGEAAGGFYERHEEPMTVENGEELAIEVDEDDFPTEITVDVYEPVEPERADLVSLPDEPLQSDELDVESGTWTVDLEPGEYYVVLQTTWPTDEMWDRMREVAYRFWIQVE